MLKTQIIKNTWKCDNCGLETMSIQNPYFNLYIIAQSLVDSSSLSIDLCKTCIQLTTIQPIVAYQLNKIVPG